MSSLYLGVLDPFSSISMAFPDLFNRVSSLAPVIQRQYSLRRFSKNGSSSFFFINVSN